MNTDGLSHINEKGEAHMVDVSSREETVRIAVASGKVTLSNEVLAAIANGQTPKGDVIATARIAGIMGAKKTSELIPLCHPIAIHIVELDLEIQSDGVAISATVKTSDRTGVEMEALTAVSVAGLTLIDMIKALDPYAAIVNVQVESKSGGRNGDWAR
jgi:cyclic pyranopterin monophosphate synthase